MTEQQMVRVYEVGLLDWRLITHVRRLYPKSEFYVVTSGGRVLSVNLAGSKVMELRWHGKKVPKEFTELRVRHSRKTSSLGSGYGYVRRILYTDCLVEDAEVLKTLLFAFTPKHSVPQ